MKTEDICKLPIKNIINKNSVLFLWVTSPLLEECFYVVKSWGFKYKSCFVWDKVLHNMGHYNSVRHEFLLICTKGKATPQTKRLLDSVVSIKRTSIHSQKPKEFREIIDFLYPNGNRVELFARQQVDGWDCWGNEV